jgi:hypothetical protein
VVIVCYAKVFDFAHRGKFQSGSNLVHVGIIFEMYQLSLTGERCGYCRLDRKFGVWRCGLILGKLSKVDLHQTGKPKVYHG